MITPRTEHGYHCHIIEWEYDKGKYKEKYRSELSFYASDEEYQKWILFNEMVKRERIIQDLTES